MPLITHMLFVDLTDNFSCQEFDRLLCNCSIKGCSVNTIRKPTCLVCAVTLPVTGGDKTNNLHTGITETLHMPWLIMVFTSFDAVILPLERSGEVEQRDRHGRFSIPSTRTTDLGTWKFVLGKSGLQVNTSEDGSTHLQLEQQRTRWRHQLSSSVNCATASCRHITTEQYKQIM